MELCVDVGGAYTPVCTVRDEDFCKKRVYLQTPGNTLAGREAVLTDSRLAGGPSSGPNFCNEPTVSLGPCDVDADCGRFEQCTGWMQTLGSWRPACEPVGLDTYEGSVEDPPPPNPMMGDFCDYCYSHDDAPNVTDPTTTKGTCL